MGEMEMERVPQAEGRRELVEYIEDASDVITLIEHHLRGEILKSVFDKKTKQWVEAWVKDGERLMNEEGIARVLSIVSARANKVISFANLSDSDVRRMAKEIRLEIIDIVIDSAEEYNIMDTRRDTIIHLVDHLVFSSLTKPKDAGTRGLYRDITTQKYESKVQPEEEQKKRSLWGGWKSNDSK